MITVLTFLVILKYDEAFRGTYFFENTRKKFKSNLILVVVVVFESKSLFFHESTFRPHETSESDGARFLHRSNPGIKRYAVSKNVWICVYAACVNLLES